MPTSDNDLIEMIKAIKNNILSQKDDPDYPYLLVIRDIEGSNRIPLDQQKKFKEIKNEISMHLINIVQEKFHLEENAVENQQNALNIVETLQQTGIENILELYKKSEVITKIKQIYANYFNSHNTFTPLASSSNNSLAANYPEQALSSQDRHISDLLATLTINYDAAPSEILQKIEQILGIRQIHQDYESALVAEAKVMDILQQLQQQNPTKFKSLIELQSAEFEKNTLLLTALSLEQLNLAKYLLQQQASIQARNEYGIDPINMLAMVAVDQVKDANNVSKTLNPTEINARINKVQELLKLMQSQNARYFQNHINSPRIKEELNQLGSSIPLTKVIAYCNTPNALAKIVKIWQDVGANVQTIISANSNYNPICRYVWGKDVEFIHQVEQIFPGTFSADNLRKKDKHNQTMLQILISLDDKNLVLNTIKAIQAINSKTPIQQKAIEDCIKTNCTQQTVASLRNILLLGLSESNLNITLENPQNFLNQLTCHKAWWEFLAQYDDKHLDAKTFVDNKIKDLEKLKHHHSHEDNIDKIINELNYLSKILNQRNNFGKTNLFP